LQNSPIQLGSINFQDFEVPQSVRFGGRQRLAVHALAGGRRIVERLGPDDDDIVFRGIFSGQAAETRARALDNLRLSGEIIWLTWESFRRRVILKSFIADYHSPWWIPYQISCIIVHQAGATGSQGVSAAALLSADLGTALAAAANASLSLTPLQTALSASNALAAGTSDQANAIAVVGSTLTTINYQIGQQSTTLVVPIPTTTAPGDLGQAYASKVSCAASLAAAVNVSAYVSRIGANITGSGI
jgi:hypothetical protein